MIVKSALLSAIREIGHGFSTRMGGVSKGPWASLNLGRGVGDDKDDVEENRARFLAWLGASQLAEVDQVHGATLLEATQAGVAGEADALFTTRPGLAVGVRTADCAPLLVTVRGARPRTVEAVAAIHAGWRGAAAGIAISALDALVARGAPIERVTLSIGPTIGLSQFEVGEEVIEAARASLHRDPPMMRSASGRAHLDLRGLLRAQLEDRGVPPAQIDLSGGCTAEERAMYFSHRRDRGTSGRHISAIFIRGERGAER